MGPGERPLNIKNIGWFLDLRLDFVLVRGGVCVVGWLHVSSLGPSPFIHSLQLSAPSPHVPRLSSTLCPLARAMWVLGLLVCSPLPHEKCWSPDTIAYPSPRTKDIPAKF